MKLAYLYRDTLKNPWYACSTVQDARFEVETSRLKICFECGVTLFGFLLDPCPSEIRSESGFTCVQEDIIPNMSGIKNTDYTLRWYRNARSSLCPIKDCSYCFFTFTVGLGQIIDGLSFPYMILPHLLI